MAVLVAGCSTTGSSSSSSNAVVAKGSTLVIYLSQPPSPNRVQKQVLEAEQLACQQLTGSILGTSLSVKCDTVGDREISDNARAAIQDESSIAYVGEIEPGDSEQTLGITNAQDLPQVSPTDTAVELTQAVSAVPGSTGKYYEAASTYGRTFARIAPTSAQEATAQVTEMKRLGVKTLYVAPGDGSDYAMALDAAVRQEAGAQGLQVSSSQSGADAIFYAADSTTAAERFAASGSATAGAGKLFLPSALAGLDFSSGSWSHFRAIYVSEPGAASSAEKSFASQFSSRYGSPDPQAAYGYAAVQALIHVLHEAGKSASNRATVVAGLHKLSNFSSVVGPVSIDSSGASSLGPSAFVFRQVRGGTLVAPNAKKTR